MNSLLSSYTAQSSRRGLARFTTPIALCPSRKASNHVYHQQGTQFRHFHSSQHSFSSKTLKSCASSSVSRSKRRLSTASSKATASSKESPNQHDSRPWELIIASSVAFASTFALVRAFPTTKNEADSLLYVPLSAQGSDDRSKLASPVVQESTGGEEKMYQISVRAVKGCRVTMEDEYFVAQGGRFAAVFDGHGGGGVSSFLKTNLYDTVQQRLAINHWETGDSTSKPSLASQVTALRQAFQQMDDQILSDDSLKYQGSTAVAVVLHESDDGHRTLLSANVGDSRAILSRRGKAIDLTRDHKPNEEKEKKRILEMGELIEWDRYAKVHRVRNLSLSRAIGDSYAKPVVSGEVEIKHFPVVDDGDEFFLLASDGLWDVMTSQDVVSYVNNRMEQELLRRNLDKHDDIESYKLVLRRNMAKFIAREALRRGSGDNVCVLIVWLKDTAATR